MTNAEYHTHPAISKSSLFKLSESPEKFKYYMDHREERTKTFTFGSAFHKAVLEPDDFDSEFAVCPNVDRRTKAGKDAWNDFCTASAGKEIVTEDDMAIISAMKQSVMANKYAKMLIERSQHEQSFFWTDELTGEQCKCRPDIMGALGGLNFISDLKSCDDASTDGFMRDAVKYGYHLQSAMYTDGLKKNTGKDYVFIFICAEKKPPYSVNVLQADDIFVKYGYDTFRDLIGLYHECKQSGNWYGYNGENGVINNLSVPAWIAKDYQ